MGKPVTNTPANNAQARKRMVPIIMRHQDGTEGAFERMAYLVEGFVHHMLVLGKKAVKVDGKAPPKGSDGDCYYDAQGCGPYWKSDL